MKAKRYFASAMALGMCLGVSSSVAAQTTNESSTQTAASSDWVTLRLNLKAGDQYQVTQNSQSKITIVTPAAQSQPAMKMEISGVTTNRVKYNVLYFNPDGTAQVRLTYGTTTGKSTIRVNGKVVQTPNNANNSNAILQGVSLEMKISSAGQVSDVRGLDTLWKKAFSQANASQMTPAMRREMESSMKKMFGDNFIKNLLQQSGMSYPQNPVRLGDSWHQRIATTGQLPFVVNLRRTLQGRANGLLSIAENGALSIGDAKNDVSIGPAALRMAITGTYQGTTIMDEATGFTRSTNLTQRFGGAMSANRRPGEQAVSARMYGLMTTRATAQKLR
jgi:hypothetical protein